MLLQSFYFKYVIMGRFSLEMFLGGLYVFYSRTVHWLFRCPRLSGC